MKYSAKILFLGRKNDFFSKKIAALLKKNFSRVTVIYSKTHHEKLDSKYLNWSGDFIFSFRNYIIIPEKLLKKVNIAAINFHPGSPKYRGIGCLNYAVLNKEKTYGVTAHLIDKKIDNGKILKIKKFSINRKKSLDKILTQTHKELYNLVIYFINLIIANKFNLKKMVKNNQKNIWTDKIYTKNDLEKLYNIDPRITKIKFNDILRATIYKKFKPHVNLFGKQFKLK